MPEVLSRETAESVVGAGHAFPRDADRFFRGIESERGNEVDRAAGTEYSYTEYLKRVAEAA